MAAAAAPPGAAGTPFGRLRPWPARDTVTTTASSVARTRDMDGSLSRIGLERRISAVYEESRFRVGTVRRRPDLPAGRRGVKLLTALFLASHAPAAAQDVARTRQTAIVTAAARLAPAVVSVNVL